jgi:hypothetical protein
MVCAGEVVCLCVHTLMPVLVHITRGYLRFYMYVRAGMYGACVRVYVCVHTHIINIQNMTVYTHRTAHGTGSP